MIFDKQFNSIFMKSDQSEWFTNLIESELSQKLQETEIRLAFDCKQLSQDKEMRWEVNNCKN